MQFHEGTRSRQTGFSLIELMVAMVLGLVVVAGLINVLVANRQAFHLQESSNFTQQNLRFVSNRIGWSLRMGDFWAGVSGTNVAGAPSVTGQGACNAAWILNSDQSVFGYDGGATFPLAGCVDDANYVKGSDVLVIRYVEPQSVSPTATRDPDRIYAVTAAGQQAYLFLGSETPPAPPLGGPLGRIIFPYAVEMYYLQPCSDRGSDGVCGTSDDGDAAARVPTLARVLLTSGGNLTSEPVVDGVEQIQFEYAVNADAPGRYVPADYVNATALDATEWPKVMSVRMSMVARSQSRDPRVPHAGTFALSGDCSYSIDTSGAVTATGCADMSTSGAGSALGDNPEQYARRLLTEVIQMRNRTRG